MYFNNIIVPTENIPNVCNVKAFGKRPIQMEHKGSQCISAKTYEHTGCSGLCQSVVSAIPGSKMFSPTCQCCQPVEVVKHNVSMTCDDGHRFFVDFHEFKQCQCKVETCGASYDTSSVTIKDPSGIQDLEKRSLFTDLDFDSMDEATKARHRRDLLNTLAMLHTNKKKR